MNTVEASFSVGLALKKTKEGEALSLLYNDIQESVSPQTWNDFERVGQKKWGEHYFTYPHALAIYEANREQEDLPVLLKQEIEKILMSDKIKIFCNQCEQFGMALEEVAKSILTPDIPKKFANIDTPPTLVRALQDLSISYQRTGCLKLLKKYYDSKEVMGKIIEFEKKNKDLNSIPFDKNVRKLIHDIANHKISAESLYFVEAFLVVLDAIKQVTFESHFNQILHLSDKDINIYRKRGKKNIELFSIKLNEHMSSIINWNGSIISFNHDNITHYALVKRRQLSWNQDSSTKITLWGIIYPYDDSISGSEINKF